MDLRPVNLKVRNITVSIFGFGDAAQDERDNRVRSTGRIHHEVCEMAAVALEQHLAVAEAVALAECMRRHRYSDRKSNHSDFVVCGALN
jgi:hypothetical protein